MNIIIILSMITTLLMTFNEILIIDWKKFGYKSSIDYHQKVRSSSIIYYNCLYVYELSATAIFGLNELILSNNPFMIYSSWFFKALSVSKATWEQYNKIRMCDNLQLQYQSITSSVPFEDIFPPDNLQISNPILFH